MPERIGAHAERLTRVAALRTTKGRRLQRRFAFEGKTLLAEACAVAFPIDEIYATQEAYDATPLVRELEARGVACYIVDRERAARISDLATPAGIVAVSPARERTVSALFGPSALLLVLADVNDPANAGTLLRSADAFGCTGVVFGSGGVDPYHPKVVRGAMGALFRLPVAVADAGTVAEAAAASGLTLVGLDAGAVGLDGERWERPVGVIVGNERHGLGPWGALCRRLVAIPMAAPSESLSAAVAGSIALYEASRCGAVK